MEISKFESSKDGLVFEFIDNAGSEVMQLEDFDGISEDFAEKSYGVLNSTINKLGFEIDCFIEDVDRYNVRWFCDKNEFKMFIKIRIDISDGDLSAFEMEERILDYLKQSNWL